MAVFSKSILIVEDDLSDRKNLQEMFSKEGFDVYEAVDGEEGLKLALEKKPDLIIIDILLPKMDGLTLMSKIRRSLGLEETPIILLTNVEPNDQILDRIAESHPSYYLTKVDTSMNEILDKTNEVLGIDKS